MILVYFVTRAKLMNIKKEIEMDNTKEIETARKLADFFALHSDLPMPSPNTALFLYTKEEALRAAKMPGAKKEYDDQYFLITVPVEGELKITYYFSRETVCTAKRTVTIEEPAQPARSYEKVVEWDCHPLLAPDRDATPAAAPVLTDEVPF